MKVATSAQIRQIDRAAIQEYSIPGIVLMENAALRTVEEIERSFSPLAGKRIAVVCGKGNNGGDGLAAARHLAARFGAVVRVWLLEPAPQFPQDAASNLAMLGAFGIQPSVVEDSEAFEKDLERAVLILDAVLGTGVSGNPRDAAARAIRAMNASSAPIVSLDLPSGINSDTGSAGEPSVNAAVTVTFGLSKIGLHVYPGMQNAGRVVVGDICYPHHLLDDPAIQTSVTSPSDVGRWLPSRAQSLSANKATYGSVLLFAGSVGFIGAACLAGEGASRSGGGLITVASPAPAQRAVMQRLVENAMTRAFPATSSGCFDLDGAKQALTLCAGASAVGIGPGIGSEDKSTQEFVVEVVRHCEKPTVIDADALNVLAMQEDRGASAVSSRSAASILTPHPGEMGRLLGIPTAQVQADRLDAVRTCAKRYGCVVLLKGARTLIAAPDGRLSINETGNTGMSSGGMGDLLTGVVATFAAQMSDPWQAATSGAYIHGLAGDLAAAEVGTAGLLPTDVARCLPKAIEQCMRNSQW